MKTQKTCGPGTALFYFRATQFDERLVDEGEEWQDPKAPRYYYHVAVALDAKEKIEALGIGVCRDNIVYDGAFDAISPPVDPKKKNEALAKLLTLVGQRYDWWEDLDDALRIISYKLFGHEWVHLPVKLIRSTARREKNCVAVLRKYLKWAGSPVRIPLFATPLQAYQRIHEYLINLD